MRTAICGFLIGVIAGCLHIPMWSADWWGFIVSANVIVQTLLYEGANHV